MDVRLFLRVLWRFRVLVLVGTCAALALTFLSMVRVTPGGSPMFAYRSSETWIAYAKVFVTEPGFPWGRRLISPPVQGAPASSTESDPGRFTGLAVLYSNLATSDPVKRILLKGGRFKSKITAAPLPANANGDPLPIIQVSGTGVTQPTAITNTKRATDALVQFIRQQQVANKIPDDDRVVLEVIESPRKAYLLTGRPKVVPVFVFVFVMGAVIGLALLFENLRPRPPQSGTGGEQEEEAEQADVATRLRMPA
jgi:hypothetical protein